MERRVTPGRVDAERFADWVEAGRAGEMEYLKRRNEQGVLLRSGVEVAMPWARSVVVCAVNYNGDGPLSIEPAEEGTGWIARYAWSGRTTESGEGLAPSDYHDEMLGRLRRVEAALHERYACETKCYVDTGPLVERAAAAKAGVGWIGKNACVLNQRVGIVAAAGGDRDLAGGGAREDGWRWRRTAAGVVRGVSMRVRRGRWWGRERWMPRDVSPI